MNRYVLVINLLSDKKGAIGKVIGEDEEKLAVNFGADYYFFHKADVQELREEDGIIMAMPLARLPREVTVQQVRDKLGIIGLDVSLSTDSQAVIIRRTA